jgi:hypothetical protein
MTLKQLNPRKALNKAFLKVKPNRTDIEAFKANLMALLDRTNDTESEEFHKNLVSDFLKKTYYEPNHFINTKGRNDLVIHNGDKASSTVGVILEAKKPTNKGEMIATGNINKKAFQELVLYYLRERITHKNLEVKYLIVTNINEWFVFDANIFDRHFAQNKAFVKQFTDFEEGRLAETKTDFFYKQIAEPFIANISAEIEFTYFNLQDYQKPLRNDDRADDHKLIALFKVLSPEHLLKQAFANDSNSLDKRFYSELLHIIGLTETKEGGKKLIQRNKENERNTGSILEDAIIQLDSMDKLSRLSNLNQFGSTTQDRLFNVALELSITWINRILFLKLLEAQLLSYNNNDASYAFLNFERIKSYDDLNSLFFQVLARKHEDRNADVKTAFAQVPYLNSSLFEPTEIEQEALFISNLSHDKQLPILPNTVLKDQNGKKRSGKLGTLEYLFEFLNAYDFGAEGSEEIQEDNKTLINASVLGLIFEKINGYKDGSFFTPGFITMYMCRETIRKAVVQKFNEAYYDKFILPQKSKGSRIPPSEGGRGEDSPQHQHIASQGEDSPQHQHIASQGEDSPQHQHIAAQGEDSSQYSSFTDIYNAIGSRRDFSHEEAAALVNAIKICDPAVGSGHFLVSALNEMIAVKHELGILADREGKFIRDYDIAVENDELVITDANGELFEYKPNNKESQRIQETLFHEKQSIIENCLFGVDINPNSVKICRLRLWIELLKNAYYTKASFDSAQPALETLPNIDINIKCGNSLVSRFAIDSDLNQALKQSKWNIESYRMAVSTYRTAQNKEQKREMERLIADIKSDFRSNIDNPFKKRISVARGKVDKLATEINTQQQWGEKPSKQLTKELETATAQLKKLEQEKDEIENNKIFENAFEWRFEFPEVLDNDGKFVGFDVVIGNPPYGATFNEQDKKYIKENYTSYKYKFDSYVYFIELGLILVKPNGILEYITPILWLSLDNCFPIRNIVVKENNLKRLFIHGEGVFEEAVVNTLSFQIEKKKPENELFILNGANSFITNKSEWINDDNLKIEFRMNFVEKTIINKMKSNSSFLSSFGDVIQGITPYDSYSGQSQEIIKSKAYHFDHKKDMTCGKWLDGKNLNRYSIIWENKWLSYGDWLAAPREKKYFIGQRILFREVPGKGRRIQASSTNEEFYYGHSISPFKPHKEFENDIDFILGIVNSKLISWYGNLTLPNFGKDVFPKLNPNDIKELPIAKAPKKSKEQISKLVEKILIEKQNPSVDTTYLENKIDRLVYELYGLSEEEIKIVEGA